MDRFLRFIVLLLVLGVALAVTIVIVSDVRSERVRGVRLAAERRQLGDYLLQTQANLRKMEIIVEQQNLTGEQVALETKLLVFPYRIQLEGGQVDLPPLRVVIPGRQLIIDGMRLDFPQGILDDGYPGNLCFPIFGHLYSPKELEGPKGKLELTESFLLIPRSQVHPGYRHDGNESTELERALWLRIGEILANKGLAQRKHVTITPLEPVALELRPGLIYTVYLGRDLGLSLEQREDARTLREMLLKDPKKSPETPVDEFGAG